MDITLLTPVMFKYNITQEELSSCKEKLALENVAVSGLEEFGVDIGEYHFQFRLFDYGIAVFQLKIELTDGKDYNFYLSEKEKATKWILNPDGMFIQTLKKIETQCAGNSSMNYFFNGKYVSYSLATYYLADPLLGYSLALKRAITEKSQLYEEQSLKVVTYDNTNKLLLIWGARIFVSEENDHYTEYCKYVKEEASAQMLWFLVTALNKKIDEYMLNNDKKRPADIELLLDYSYGVLYRKSKFDAVKNSRVHRYEIEVSTSIISASKLDTICGNLEKKIDLLKEKSSIITNKQNKKNQKFVNILLVLISFLSATSTIYGFISVFTGDNNKRTLYVIISASVFLLLGIGYLIKNGVFKRKKRK